MSVDAHFGSCLGSFRFEGDPVLRTFLGTASDFESLQLSLTGKLFATQW